jgi:polyvinyl alcohol dehydrogenase (cytochrome)
MSMETTMRTMFLTLLACAAAVDAAAQPPRPEPGAPAAAAPARPDPAALRIEQGLCTASTPLRDAVPQRWNGWGAGVTNTRFQNAEAGGITVADVPRLELKWAYGLPREQQPRGQPSVIGGRLFVGSQAGAVYALDAKTGCTLWQFFPEAGLRSATSVGPHRFAAGRDGYAVYFVDSRGHAYALDADSGAQIWTTRVEDHPMVRGTGAVTLHEGTVFVPMTGINEAMGGANPDYACCTFRGSMTALDAATGAVRWKTFTIPESKPRGTSSTGKPLWGPAGVGIWNAPTVDAKRGVIYSGTGPAYAGDDPPTTDAVVAFDMKTGAIVWANQFTKDTWLNSCDGKETTNANCPKSNGPDLDFSASPILTVNSAGRDVIVIPQKSGMVFALDPAERGKTLWSYRAGPGGPVGGVWGSAVEGDRMYVAVGGYRNEQTGGIHALDIDTGERIWYTPPQPLLCAPAGPLCSATQAAAVTAVPGAVFSGSADGGLRAYDARDGKVIWAFDANREFTTVNSVPARGASFDGSGPVIAGGMLYVLSGDAGFVGRPGNVLLAFGVE